jgi:hypothetical protein
MLEDAIQAAKQDVIDRHVTLQEEHRVMGYCFHCSPEIRAWRGFIRLVTGRRVE